MNVAPSTDKLNFSYLLNIYICIYSSHVYASGHWDITITVWKVSKCEAFSGPHFPVFGLNTVFSPNTGKYGQEKTPYLDSFHAVHELLMSPNQIYPIFWINILQDLHGQSSHFQVLIRFLKRASWGILVGTCCQSWLARCGTALSPHFNEGFFYVWKIWNIRRLYIFSLNLKI